MSSDGQSPPVPRGEPIGSPVEGLPDLAGFPTKRSLTPEGRAEEEAKLDEAKRPIACQAPRRPKALDAVIMLFLIPGPYLLMFAAGGGPRIARALGLPRALEGAFALGLVGGLLAVLGLLLHSHATRYRAAHISEEGIILGLLEPRPRGVWLRWRDVAGFRVGTGRIVLAVRGKPWTRWLGPIVECDDELLHRVVVRLEAKGVRRLDG